MVRQLWFYGNKDVALYVPEIAQGSWLEAYLQDWIDRNHKQLKSDLNDFYELSGEDGFTMMGYGKMANKLLHNHPEIGGLVKNIIVSDLGSAKSILGNNVNQIRGGYTICF